MFRNKKKNEQKIIAILIILVLLGVVVFVYVLNDKSIPAPQVSPIVVIPNITPVQKDTKLFTPENIENYEKFIFSDNTLDTSDWQTYRNEKYGFEVRYPRGWKVKDFSKFNGYDKRIVFHPPWGDGDDRGVWFFVYKGSTKSSTEKIISKEPSMSWTKKLAYINNAKIIQLLEVNSADGEVKNPFKKYIIGGGVNTFEVYDLVPGYFSQELEQIILSFKFIK